MRTIIVGRLSKRTDADQTGFDSQEREAVRWAEAHGHEVVAKIADVKTGRAGLSARPNLRPWVTDPERLAAYDGIVTLKLDRLTRGNAEETADLEAWAREHGKTLMTTEGLIFPCEGVDGIRWDLAKRMAHDEWLRISERYTRMLRGLREDNSLTGRVPYGYRMVRDGRRKALEPDPDEAQVIHDVVRWYLDDDMSFADIANKLNAEGRLPRPLKNKGQAQWQPSVLSRMLKKETLAGRKKSRDGKRTVQKIEHPVLDRETWEKITAKIAQRAYRAGISQSKTPAMLTSIIQCGNCNRNMYRNRSGNGSLRYHCRACGQSILLTEAEEQVNLGMLQDNGHDVVPVIIPSTGNADQIADVKRDIHEAIEAGEFEKATSLMAEVQRLSALPSEPPRVEYRPAKETVAEAWSRLPNDAARRAYLLKRETRVGVETDEVGQWLVVHIPALKGRKS